MEEKYKKQYNFHHWYSTNIVYKVSLYKWVSNKFNEIIWDSPYDTDFQEVTGWDDYIEDYEE